MVKSYINSWMDMPPVSLIIYVSVIKFQTSIAKGFVLPSFTQVFLIERLCLICDREHRCSCLLVEGRFSAWRTSPEGLTLPPLSCVLVKEECHSRKKGHCPTQSSGAVALTLCPGCEGNHENRELWSSPPKNWLHLKQCRKVKAWSVSKTVENLVINK